MVDSKSDETYIDLSILFESPQEEFNLEQLRVAILQSFKNLFGQVGMAMPVEVTKHKQISSTHFISVIKVRSRNIKKVVAALTLLGSYNGSKCCIRTNEVIKEGHTI